MSVKATLDGDMRIACGESATGDQVLVDAPKEVGGLAEKMGPTDLFCASLASCILVMMGMRARRLKLDISGTTVDVEKEMVNKPAYRIGKLTVKIRVPVDAEDDAQRQIETVAKHCPIHLSLDSSIEQDLQFEWGA